MPPAVKTRAWRELFTGSDGSQQQQFHVNETEAILFALAQAVEEVEALRLATR